MSVPLAAAESTDPANSAQTSSAQTSSAQSGSARGPIEIPQPTGLFAGPFSVRKLGAYLSCFGPAAVAASVSIGAGETLVVVETGAWARFGLLWLILLAVLVKGIFTTYLMGRYTALTGEYFGHRVVRFPGPRGWLLLLLIVCELSVAGPICAVISRPCGNLLAYLLAGYLPGTSRFWEVAFAMLLIVAAVGLSLRMSYKKLEAQNLALCAILVGGTVLAMFLVAPEPAAALAGALIPQFPLTPFGVPEAARAYNFPYFLLLITVFGFTGNSVFGYLVYANWVGLHGWGLTAHPDLPRIRQELHPKNDYSYLPLDPEQVRRARALLTPVRWDVALGAAVLLIVTASFMMSGAQVLYPEIAAGHMNYPSWRVLLTEQRLVWVQLNAMLVPVYYVCVLVALWGTLNALPEIWTRVTHEFLTAIWPRVESWSYRRFQYAIAALIVVPALLLLACDANLEALGGIIATLTCNVGVAVACGLALYLNGTLPRPYRPSWPTFLGGLLSSGILLVTALVGLCTLAWQLVKLVGG